MEGAANDYTINYGTGVITFNASQVGNTLRFVYSYGDPDGRPVVSLASLKEPGTFDPARMGGQEFRGVAQFTVLAGPVPAAVAFDELITVARGLAGQLGGLLQDDRGGALSLERVASLREDVIAFERARAVAAGG